MNANRWNVLRVAGYGAIAGALYGLARTYLAFGALPGEYVLASALGSALVGALLFGIAAIVRNSFART